MICRGRAILAEYSERDGRYAMLAQAVLDHLPSDNMGTYEHDGWVRILLDYVLLLVITYITNPKSSFIDHSNPNSSTSGSPVFLSNESFHFISGRFHTRFLCRLQFHYAWATIFCYFCIAEPHFGLFGVECYLVDECG